MLARSIVSIGLLHVNPRALNIGHFSSHVDLNIGVDFQTRFTLRVSFNICIDRSPPTPCLRSFLRKIASNISGSTSSPVLGPIRGCKASGRSDRIQNQFLGINSSVRRIFLSSPSDTRSYLLRFR